MFAVEAWGFESPEPLARLPELERGGAQAREARQAGTAMQYDVRPWIVAAAPAGDAARGAVDALRANGVVAFAGESADAERRTAWVVLDAASQEEAEAHLAEAGGAGDWSFGRWFASAQLAHLPRMARRDDAPTFEVLPVPDEGPLAPFHGAYAKFTTTFGVRAVATAGVTDRQLLHATHLLAQYMDNDEDGEVDDAAVHAALVAGGAFLVMDATDRRGGVPDPDWEALEAAGVTIGQDLYGEETLPDGPPHRPQRGRFDAALEEVWHLVSNGWEVAHPEAFGYEAGSALCDAMDLARGGRFDGPPDAYPDGAWYHYDDRTCDYECMAAEYFYWGLTSLLGGQDYPGRAEEIADEWRCPTPALFAERDVALHALLTDERWNLPRVLPDGSYGP